MNFSYFGSLLHDHPSLLVLAAAGKPYIALALAPPIRITAGKPYIALSRRGEALHRPSLLARAAAGKPCIALVLAPPKIYRAEI